MSKRDRSTEETLDLHSLDHVTGGLRLAMLPAMLANQRQHDPFGTASDFGDGGLGSFGANAPFGGFSASSSIYGATSAYGAPSLFGTPSVLGLGGNHVHLNASVAYNVNARHGQVLATNETYQAAQALAQQTNGALVFGGDVNRDGRIGAE